MTTPKMLARTTSREAPLTVWGSGLQGRDFVHIDDCIEAALRILAKVNDGSGINIGSGKLINFREVARLFAKLEGYEPEIKSLDDKPEGMHARHADIAYMKKILDWGPTISIEEGFGRVLRVAHERKAKGM